jgi:hypothetical protein
MRKQSMLTKKRAIMKSRKMSRMKGGENGWFSWLDGRSDFMRNCIPLENFKEMITAEYSGDRSDELLRDKVREIFEDAKVRCRNDTTIEYRVLNDAAYKGRFSIEAFCAVLTIYVSIPKFRFSEIFFKEEDNSYNYKLIGEYFRSQKKN